MLGVDVFSRISSIIEIMYKNNMHIIAGLCILTEYLPSDGVTERAMGLRSEGREFESHWILHQFCTQNLISENVAQHWAWLFHPALTTGLGLLPWPARKTVSESTKIGKKCYNTSYYHRLIGMMLK